MATIWPPSTMRLTSTAGCHRTFPASMMYTPAGLAVRPKPPPDPEPVAGAAFSLAAAGSAAERGGRNQGDPVAFIGLPEDALHSDGVTGLLHELVGFHVRPPGGGWTNLD